MAETRQGMKFRSKKGDHCAVHCSRYTVASPGMALNLDSNSEMILGRERRDGVRVLRSLALVSPLGVYVEKPVEA